MPPNEYADGEYNTILSILSGYLLANIKANSAPLELPIKVKGLSLLEFFSISAYNSSKKSIGTLDKDSLWFSCPK